jgi:hypothetical protein
MTTKTKSTPDRLDNLQAELRAMKEEMRENMRVLLVSSMSTSSALHAMREAQMQLPRNWN